MSASRLVSADLPTGSNVRAVLDVMRRPKLFGSRVVTLVEQRIERFRDKRLVLFGASFWHPDSFLPLEVLSRSLRWHRLVRDKTPGILQCWRLPHEVFRMSKRRFPTWTRR